MNLVISHILYPVYNLGPGCRIGVWFQGCSIHCPGCLNPESWDSNGGKRIDLMELYLAIREVADNFTGISISGGEPFDQYDALVLLCYLVKQNTSLDVLVFSGYELSALVTNHPDLHFLDVMDYLIDGPFVRNFPANEGLIGSTNQYTYQITGHIAKPIHILPADQPWSVQVNSNHTAYLSGIPRSGEMDKLVQLLSAKGISWSNDAKM